MRRIVSLFIVCFSLVSFGAYAAETQHGPATISSPDHVLSVSLTATPSGVTYSVSRFGEPVVDASRLGLRFKNARALSTGLEITGVKTRSVDNTWKQPWGEREYVRNHYNEMTVDLTEVRASQGADSGRHFQVVFRVYDDGLGFRYVFPKDSGLGKVEITKEMTEFNFHDDATAWWIPSRGWNRYEYLYQKTPLDEVTMAHTPFTIRTKYGLHISVHEAALVNYSGMSLRRVSSRHFVADLAPWSDGVKVKTKAPFVTPWRTMQIADSAGGLIMSDLILNLNEPNKLGDVSWIEPGKYVGVWWAMHLGKWTWGSGPHHGATTKNVKDYIDFAAKYGFKGVLVEGWNQGWDGDWFNNGSKFSFTKAYPDFDFKELSKYAAKRGVRIIGHHETAGDVCNYEKQMNAAFALDEKMGVRQVKTGYVANGGELIRCDKHGKIHNEWHDGQFSAEHHIRVLEAAAKHHVSIISHEPIKDTGLRRTYPNWLSREGARGQEYNAWGTPGNPPSHTAILPFTRMLSGPMDFTPGIFDLLYPKAKPNNRVSTTLAKQLALYVVLYSPVQMAADLPENYLKHMDAFQFIRDVPTDWADTRVLTGEIGEQVTIVRKDRHSEDWYLGSLTDEHGRFMKVSLGFLTPGVTYEAQIYADGPNAHWKTNPYDMTIKKIKVTSADTFPIRLAAGGGMAVRFTPVKK
ncbi:glycoside hydrolase family 97 protein [Kordiimonas marina]|uniref:glycoside hydrolase family 97 protein n=1 Tax=Kordiimonas marina TaxID=2872312 RepID=UPI001FF2DAE0|nr:glycoside hydrolase family 97 protein [Kordiimonas marina]